VKLLILLWYYFAEVDITDILKKKAKEQHQNDTSKNCAHTLLYC